MPPPGRAPARPRASFLDDLAGPTRPSFLDDAAPPPAPAPRPSFLDDVPAPTRPPSFLDDVINPPVGAAPILQSLQAHQQARLGADVEQAVRQAASPQVPVVQATLPQQLGKIWDFRLPVSFLGGTTGQAWKDWGRAIVDPWIGESRDDIPTILKPVVSLFGVIEPYTIPGRTLMATLTSGAGVGPHESSLPIYYAKAGQLADKARNAGWGSWVQNAIMAGGAAAGMLTDAALDPYALIRSTPRSDVAGAVEDLARARTVGAADIENAQMRPLHLEGEAPRTAAEVLGSEQRMGVAKHAYRAVDNITPETARSYLAPRYVEQTATQVMDRMEGAPRDALQETLEAAKTTRAGDYQAMLQAHRAAKQVPTPERVGALPPEVTDPAQPLDVRLQRLALFEESVAREAVAGQRQTRLYPPTNWIPGVPKVSIPLLPKGLVLSPFFFPQRIAGRTPGELLMTRRIANPGAVLNEPLAAQLTALHPSPPRAGQAQIQPARDFVVNIPEWAQMRTATPPAAAGAVAAATAPQLGEWAIHTLQGHPLMQSGRYPRDVTVFEGVGQVLDDFLGGVPRHLVPSEEDLTERVMNFIGSVPRVDRPGVFDALDVYVRSVVAGLDKAAATGTPGMSTPPVALGYAPQILRRVAYVLSKHRNDPVFWQSSEMMRRGRGIEPRDYNQMRFAERMEAIRQKLAGDQPDGSKSLETYLRAAQVSNDPNVHVFGMDQMVERAVKLPFKDTVDAIGRYQAEMDYKVGPANSFDQRRRTRSMHRASQEMSDLVKQTLDVADAVFRNAPPLDWLRTLSNVMRHEDGRRMILDTYGGLERAGVTDPGRAAAADAAAVAAGASPPIRTARDQYQNHVMERLQSGEITNAEAVDLVRSLDRLTDESFFRLARDFEAFAYAQRESTLHARVLSELTEPLSNFQTKLNDVIRQGASVELQRLSDWWASMQAVHEPNALGKLYNERVLPKVQAIQNWAFQQAGADPRAISTTERWMNEHGQVNHNAEEDVYARQVVQGYQPLLQRFMGNDRVSHQMLYDMAEGAGHYWAHVGDLQFEHPNLGYQNAIRRIAQREVDKALVQLGNLPMPSSAGVGGRIDLPHTFMLLEELRPIVRPYTEEIFNGARAAGSSAVHRADYLPWRRVGSNVAWDQFYKTLEEMRVSDAGRRGHYYMTEQRWSPEEMRNATPSQIRYEIEKINEIRRGSSVPELQIDLDHNLVRVLADYKAQYEKMRLNRHMVADLHQVVGRDLLPITRLTDAERAAAAEQLRASVLALEGQIPPAEFRQLIESIGRLDDAVLDPNRDLIPGNIMSRLRGNVPDPVAHRYAPAGFHDLGGIVPSMRGWYVRDALYRYLERFAPFKNARGLEAEAELFHFWVRWMNRIKQIMVGYDLSNFVRMGALAFTGGVHPWEWARVAHEIHKLAANEARTGTSFERWTSFVEPYARAARKMPEFQEAYPYGLFSRGGHEAVKGAGAGLDAWLEPRKVLRPGAVWGAGTGAAIGGFFGGPPGAAAGAGIGSLVGWTIPGHLRRGTGLFDRAMFDWFDVSLKITKYRQLRKAGLSPQAAADLTNHFMLDYSLRYMSPNARQLGYAFFPFFGWQTGNHLLHGINVWSNPSKYALWDHASEAVSQFWGDTEPDDRRAEILRYAIATNLEDTLSDRALWLKSIAPWHGMFRMGRRTAWGVAEMFGQGMPGQEPQGDLMAPARYLVQRTIEPVRTVGLASSPFERMRQLELRDAIFAALESGDYEAVARDPKLWSLFSDLLWGFKPWVHATEFLVSTKFDPMLWKKLPREVQHDLLRTVFDTIEVDRNDSGALRPAQP